VYVEANIKAARGIGWPIRESLERAARLPWQSRLRLKSEEAILPRSFKFEVSFPLVKIHYRCLLKLSTAASDRNFTHLAVRPNPGFLPSPTRIVPNSLTGNLGGYRFSASSGTTALQSLCQRRKRGVNSASEDCYRF